MKGIETKGTTPTIARLVQACSAYEQCDLLLEGTIRKRINNFGVECQESDDKDDILQKAKELEDELLAYEDSEMPQAKTLIGIYRTIIYHYLSEYFEEGDPSEARWYQKLSEDHIITQYNMFSSKNYESIEDVLLDIAGVINEIESGNYLNVYGRRKKLLISYILNTVLSVVSHKIGLNLQYQGSWNNCIDKWQKVLDIIAPYKKYCIIEYFNIQTRINGLRTRTIGTDNPSSSHDPLEEIETTLAEIYDVVNNTEIGNDIVHDEQQVDVIRRNLYIFVFENNLHNINALLASKKKPTTKRALQMFVDIIELKDKQSQRQGLLTIFEDEIEVLKYKFCRMFIEDPETFVDPVTGSYMPSIQIIFKSVPTFTGENIRMEDTLQDLTVGLSQKVEDALSERIDDCIESGNYRVALELFINFARLRNIHLEQMQSQLINSESVDADLEHVHLDSGNKSAKKHIKYMQLLFDTFSRYEVFEYVIEHAVGKNHNLMDAARLRYTKHFLYKLVYELPNRRTLIQIYNINPRLATGLFLSGKALNEDSKEELEDLLQTLQSSKRSKHADENAEHGLGVVDVPEEYEKFVVSERFVTRYDISSATEVLNNTYTKMVSLLTQAIDYAQHASDINFVELISDNVKKLLLFSYARAYVDTNPRMRKKLTPSMLLVKNARHDPDALDPTHEYSEDEIVDLLWEMYDFDIEAAIDSETILARNKSVVTGLHRNVPLRFYENDEGLTVSEPEWDEIFKEMKVIFPIDTIHVIENQQFATLSEKSTDTLDLKELMDRSLNPPTLNAEEVAFLKKGIPVMKTSTVDSAEGLRAPDPSYNHFALYPIFTNFDDCSESDIHERKPYIMVFVSHMSLAGNGSKDEDRDEKFDEFSAIERMQSSIDVMRFAVRSTFAYATIINKALRLKSLHDNMGVEDIRNRINATLDDVTKALQAAAKEPSANAKTNNELDDLKKYLDELERAQSDSSDRHLELIHSFIATNDHETSEHILRVDMLAERVASRLHFSDDDKMRFIRMIAPHVSDSGEIDLKILGLARAFLSVTQPNQGTVVLRDLERLETHMYLNDEQRRVFVSGMRHHDDGKLLIPKHVLLKPGIFTPDEREAMDEHLELSVQIARAVGSEDIAQIARSHHMLANHLPENHVISALPAAIDVYEALTSTRRSHYRDPATLEELKGIMGRNKYVSDNLKKVFLQNAEYFYGVGKTVLCQALVLKMLQSSAPEMTRLNPFLRIELPENGLRLGMMFREYRSVIDPDEPIVEQYESFEERISALYPGDLNAEFEKFLYLRIQFEMMERINESQPHMSDANHIITRRRNITPWQLSLEHDSTMTVLKEMIEEYDALPIEGASMEEQTKIIKDFLAKHGRFIAIHYPGLSKRLNEIASPYMQYIAAKVVKARFPNNEVLTNCSA